MATASLRWSDPRVRSVVWQVLILGSIAALVAFLVVNVNANRAQRHIASGFGFLDREAHVPIAEALIPYSDATSTFARALVEGLLNTLRIAVVGVVLATVLGTLVGIGQLSRNALLARLCAIYVEVARDIPVLVQLLIWYAVLKLLPVPRQAIHLGGSFLSNRGIIVPMPLASPAWSAMFWAALAGAVLAWFWARWTRVRRARLGRAPPALSIGAALVVGLPLLAWLAYGAPTALEYPALRGFNFGGGTTLSPEYAALLIGLVVYTAAYIAEVVRSGLLAVSHGQTEAATALGLSHGQTLRLIVLPQALRVIIPPLTSEYLNLTKNSSLAVAIGYQDVVSIANTTMTQTGQALEGVTIIMGTYLVINLATSALMSWYERRNRLVER